MPGAQGEQVGAHFRWGQSSCEYIELRKNMSDDTKRTPLFEGILQAMRIAEKSSPEGPRKRDLVLGLLMTTGLIKEGEREHIGVIIDLIIYCAQNAGELKHFMQSSGCLPCLR
jgi:hypothetical protein